MKQNDGYIRYKRSKTIPEIVFNNCNELILRLQDFFDLKQDVNVCVGLLIYKLGILNDESDIFEFKNFDKKENSCNLIINNSEFYKIYFNNNSKKEIILVDKNVSYKFDCILIKDIELNMRVVLSSCSIYDGKYCYTKNFSRDYYEFFMEDDDNIFEFKVQKPNDVILPIIDKNGKYARYELDNEDILNNYLLGLRFPISIIDVYRMIEDISLNRVDNYPEILMKVSKKVDDTKIVVTDIIHLLNGNVNRIGIKIPDSSRIMILDKNGNWFYENFEDLIKIENDGINNIINYSISLNNRNNLDMVRINFNIQNAYNDLDRVKKLMKRYFTK